MTGPAREIAVAVCWANGVIHGYTEDGMWAWHPDELRKVIREMSHQRLLILPGVTEMELLLERVTPQTRYEIWLPGEEPAEVSRGQWVQLAKLLRRVKG